MPVSIHQPLNRYRKFLLAAFGDAGQKVYDIGAALADPDAQEQYFRTLIADLKRVTFKEGERSVVELQYKHDPVDPETYLKDKYFLGLEEELYPEVIPYFIEMNSGRYVEVVLTGGIGSAKTSLAIWTQAYQLYLLSCLRNPHAVYGLDRSSEVELIFQSITATLAEAVDYARFRALIVRSPYFQRNFPHDPSLKSELHFPNRVIVKPVSGSNIATIGQNVVGGLIDELNYMAVVGKSSKSADKGQTYDQAVALYNSIARRRKSRYYKQGRLPGVLCLVSSKKYPGQFTDLKMEEAKTDPTIYVYDKRVWDIKPDSFSSKSFTVFIGDEFRKPRILEDKEKVKAEDEQHLVKVPVDFRTDFERDIVDALREIAGVSHLSKSPFFTNKEALLGMFKPHPSIFSREVVDFVSTNLEIIKAAIVTPHLPRWAHIDLGQTGDSAGFALGHCPGFVKVERGGMQEMMPRIRIDGVLEIQPPKGGEIMFFKVRRILYVLRKLGVNVRWVSYDTWQSVDSMQLLQQKGFAVGPQSVDVDTVPYDFFKGAVYDERVESPLHATLKRELKDLQLNAKDQKVDHLPNGSKDCADAVCGVVYGLTVRREIWAMFGVPINEALAAMVQKSDRKVKESVTTDTGGDE